MTFTALPPRLMRRQDPVIVSVSFRNDRGVRNPHFEISFSSRFITEMKWKKGDRIEIAVGDGPERGLIRLRPSDTGYVLRLAGTSPRLRLSARYWGNDITRYPAGSCNFRPDTINRTLTVELPWQPRGVARGNAA